MGYLEKEAMERKERIEELTQLFGRKLFAIVHKESQSIWKPFYWKQALMLWFGKNEILRNQMLKFVSKYPALKTQEEKADCFKKYFLDELELRPFIFKLVPIVQSLPSGKKLIGAVVDFAIRAVARYFIVGDSKKEILKAVKKLEKEGASCNLDVLGEEVLAEEEAEKYLQRYLSLLKIVKAEVSLKPSGLCSNFGSESAVEYLKTRLERIFREGKAGVTVDIEQYCYRNLIFIVLREVLHRHEFMNFDGAGIAFQTYLRDWQESLRDLVSDVLGEGRPVKIRLVKGAYWDSEVESARKEGREPSVFTEKWQTDLAFETACHALMFISMLYGNQIKIAVASHNIRSVAKVMALAETYNFPKDKLEFQVLYGMGYPLMRAIIKMGYPVKIYVPIGELVRGVAFLVRRIVENTSQSSFVFQSFDKKIPIEELLKNPAENLKP